MPEILTDQEVLRQKSEVVTEAEVSDILTSLTESIPQDRGLGLSAPQIGIFKRAFIAKLSSGLTAFVNPVITVKSPGKVPSTEGCLSLPGIQRCLERHQRVTIEAEMILRFEENESLAKLVLTDRDAFIVQHETDHLDGVLIIDHPETKTHEERYQEKQEKRQEKLQNKRQIKKNKGKTAVVIGAKRLKKQKESHNKEARRMRRQEKIRVETEERYAIQQKKIFTEQKPEENPQKEAIIEPSIATRQARKFNKIGKGIRHK